MMYLRLPRWPKSLSHFLLGLGATGKTSQGGRRIRVKEYLKLYKPKKHIHSFISKHIMVVGE